MSEKYSEMLKVIEEVWSKGDLDRLDEFYAANAVRHMPPGADAEGLEAIRASATDISSTQTAEDYRIVESFEDGDKIASLWTLQTRIIASGNVAPFKGSTIYHMENGKIIEEWTYYDTLGLFQQLGLVPSTEEIMEGNS